MFQLYHTLSYHRSSIPSTIPYYHIVAVPVPCQCSITLEVSQHTPASKELMVWTDAHVPLPKDASLTLAAPGRQHRSAPATIVITFTADWESTWHVIQLNWFSFSLSLSLSLLRFLIRFIRLCNHNDTQKQTQCHKHNVTNNVSSKLRHNNVMFDQIQFRRKHIWCDWNHLHCQSWWLSLTHTPPSRPGHQHPDLSWWPLLTLQQAGNACGWAWGPPWGSC